MLAIALIICILYFVSKYIAKLESKTYKNVNTILIIVTKINVTKEIVKILSIWNNADRINIVHVF